MNRPYASRSDGALPCTRVSCRSCAAAPRPRRNPQSRPGPGGLSRGGLFVAGADARPRRHGLALPPPGPPRQHRLPARRPLRSVGLQRHGLLQGAAATAAAGVPDPDRAGRRDAPLGDRRGRPLARPSGVDRRRHGLLDGRRPRTPEPLRPAFGPASRLRVPHGPSGRPDRSGDRHAFARREQPDADPRHVADGPRRGRVRARRRHPGRSRLLFLCAHLNVARMRLPCGVPRIRSSWSTSRRAAPCRRS